MIKSEIDISSLEAILNNVIGTIKKSKEQIFEIIIDAKTEKDNTIQKLEDLKLEVKKVISEVDKLETEYKLSRQYLANVSKSLKNYSETNILKAYEEANQLQVNLFIAKEREWNLKSQRKDLEIRLKSIDLTIERASMLINQMNIVFDFLTGDIVRMAEVMESAKLRQIFGMKIIQAQEEERKRLAREIHDGPAQTMANVVLRTEIAERLMNQQQFEQAVQELKDLKSMIRKSLADVKQIIFDLRPMALDDLGLLPTLRKFITEIAKRENLNIELTIFGKERRVPSGMEVAIFRLIQEVINNVIKHAHATKVQVNLEFTDELISVIVKDNGVGFVEEEIIKNRNHFGLMGMKERVKLLEGNHEIFSKKNQGTTITFKVPVNESGE